MPDPIREYDADTDRVIYSGACDHLDNAGFARLALAALDQAGVSVKGQARIADALEVEGVLTPEERAATGL